MRLRCCLRGHRGLLVGADRGAALPIRRAAVACVGNPVLRLRAHVRHAPTAEAAAHEARDERGSGARSGWTTGATPVVPTEPGLHRIPERLSDDGELGILAPDPLGLGALHPAAVLLP